MGSFPPLLGISAGRSKGGWLVLPDFPLLPARKENSWEGSFGIGATAPSVPALEGMEELPHGGGGGISCLMESAFPPSAPPPRPISFITEYVIKESLPELEGTHKAQPIQLLMSSSPHL